MMIEYIALFSSYVLLMRSNFAVKLLLPIAESVCYLERTKASLVVFFIVKPLYCVRKKMFVERFRSLQRTSLHGYFDAIHFAFNEFLQYPGVVEIIVYSGRSVFVFLITDVSSSRALFKGVVMRRSQYCIVTCVETGLNIVFYFLQLQTARHIKTMYINTV